MKRFLDYDLGGAFERTARNLAPAIATVITAWVLLEEAGQRFDTWWLQQWCGIEGPALAVVAAAAPATPPAPVGLSAADILPLDLFNVHELRVLCRQRIGSDVRPGGRGLYQSRRADLIALLENN